MKYPAIAAVLGIALLTGCQNMTEAKPSYAVVSGNVIYFQRVALPPDALVTVQLKDISRMDANAVVLGEQRIETNGRQVPIPFEIEYDSSAIDYGMIYAVSARIEQGERLLWISDTVHPVITRGAPTSGIDLKVVPARR
jgi:putative lipoprotein